MNQKSNRSIIIWLLTGCLLIAAMVIIGGITRLTHSGLSMVEWKLIMGSIPPLNEAEWIEAFEKYKQFPEYQLLHSYFTLEDFKSIFIWEYLHRLLGRVLGLVFLIPFIFFLIKKRINSSLLKKLLLIFVWGGFQGFLGWFMVKSGLVDNPNVSHYRLAIHLVTAFSLCAYIFWVVLGLMDRVDNKVNTVPKAKGIGVVLFIFSLFQIIYGAFVAGLKAGFIHTTWPKMSGYWISPSVLDAINTKGAMALINDPVTVQFVHRWLAMVVLGIAIYIFFKLKSKSLNLYQRRARILLLITISFQVLLGIFTLILAVPITVAVAHQLVALLLLIAEVYYLFHFKEEVKVKPIAA